MTGEDHDTDALIAALRSPALPSERVGEDVAVTAMLDALSAAPARPTPTGHRSRRGIAIAAVTVASLGVGGLVAAGPGNFFFPAADRSPTTGPTSTMTAAEPSTRSSDDVDASAPPASDGVNPTSTLVATIAEPGTDLVTSDDAETDECDAENHGDAVSEVARSTVPGDEVRATAHSDCGKPDSAGGPGDNPSITAPGQTGENPSITAPGQTGESPATTAPGQTSESPATTAPGQTGESPATTAPAQPGPGHTDGNSRP